MNIQDYQAKLLFTYEAFAKTVRFILHQALKAADELPSPQSIQYRAKSAESIRKRLAEDGSLDTQTLELERRDLAGVRLIFYTNNDVDRFLASPVVADNFVIDEDSTKYHHPSPDNDDTRYRAVHFTVRLRDERLCHPEYYQFKGMRCEIQVQTILNHAWSETSHDVLYKKNIDGGYGRKAMEGIAKRFERIMDKYLIPAGFEIQKAQQEYERVLQGKELFDKNITSLLSNAQDNNQRHELLSRLKDYAIPHYDDHSAAFKELKDPLLRLVRAARETEPSPIVTTYGNMEGFNASSVTNLVLDIVDDLRYAGMVSSLALLIEIYRDEPDEEVRQRIRNVVKNLSEFNIAVYERVGLAVQETLINYLAELTESEIDCCWPIALTVWTEIIQPDISGTDWKADAVVFKTGAIPISNQLCELRNKAINGLIAAYDRAPDDERRRSILLALDSATRTSSRGEYSNAFLATTLNDSKRIVRFAIERSSSMSFELKQHLENRFHSDYFRAKEIANDSARRFDSKTEAEALMSEICRFRDLINKDEQFVRYKVLVGFESIYPDHWIDKEFDFKGADDYRRNEASKYIDEISALNEADWFRLIERCAETDSGDLATFPVFGRFLNTLAEQKPEIADRLLAKATRRLRTFLPAFLNGLYLSGRSDLYEKTIKREIESAEMLAGIGRHLRYPAITNPALAERLRARAICAGDTIAVIECVLFALEHFGTEKIRDSDKYLDEALQYLIDHQDARWVSEAWFLEKTTKVYEKLTSERAEQILESLIFARRVNYQIERILVRIAEHHLDAVWDYFGARLAKETSDDLDDERFEAVPFQFHGLETVLSTDVPLAVAKGLSWFKKDRALFRFRGGRLLSNTFPTFDQEFSDALGELIRTEGATEADFALSILQNYSGTVSTYSVLKEIVSQFPKDSHKMSAVRASIDNTGVVSGETGLANAWQARKASLQEWLNDERPAVKDFAKRHIVELDQMIASELHHNETDREMRKRDYNDDDLNVDDDDERLD